MKQVVMGWACGMYGREEKYLYIQGVGGESVGKEITEKT
jgi:hypothetical protein